MYRDPHAPLDLKLANKMGKIPVWAARFYPGGNALCLDRDKETSDNFFNR